MKTLCLLSIAIILLSIAASLVTMNDRIELIRVELSKMNLVLIDNDLGGE